MKWTIYSEEKPQMVGSYLVTYTTDSGRYYVDYDYWTVCDKFKYHSTDVVAWMPFPKPYSKDEPQTDYDKGLKLFADILFDKEKSEPFLKECKAMGIEPQTDCDGCQHYADEYTADACYECKRSYADCYEPQTDCPKSCPSRDICTKDETDCAWK